MKNQKEIILHSIVEEFIYRVEYDELRTKFYASDYSGRTGFSKQENLLLFIKEVMQCKVAPESMTDLMEI